MKTVPRLVVLGGARDGYEHVVNTPIVRIGRRDDQDVALATYPAVSRQHATVTEEDGEYWLADAGSSSGTFLGDAAERLLHRERLLSGAVIRLGPFTRIRFELDATALAIEQIRHVMNDLSTRVANLKEDKRALVRSRLTEALPQLEAATDLKDFMVQLRQLVATIDSAAPGVPDPAPLDALAKSLPHLEASAPGIEEEGLKALKTFLRTDLDRIVLRIDNHERQ
jgi:pSer/pThr/pTyr-binding forkhead associated (FHA) protein